VEDVPRVLGPRAHALSQQLDSAKAVEVRVQSALDQTRAAIAQLLQSVDPALEGAG